MAAELWIAFALASAVLGMIPGPNVALTVSNSLAHGRSAGLMTVAGTSSAMIPQLMLTVLGMTALTAALAEAFNILRWAGVIYLVYLGWRYWTTPPRDLSKVDADTLSSQKIFMRGFMVSSVNPKTLLFYGAFFPQFISPGEPVMPQLLVLAATFFAVVTIIDCGWVLLAASARRFFQASGGFYNKITGGFLIAAAIGLSVAKK